MTRLSSPVISSRVVPFRSLNRNMLSLAGGKNIGLGELINAGIPVPPGFAVTTTGYSLFVTPDIKSKIASILNTHNLEDSESLEKASKEIRSIIEDRPLPPALRTEILRNYRKLGTSLGVSNPLVAVRSSATAEDLPGSAFAGAQETYLFIKGEQELLEKVKKCMSSLYTARAISYRKERGFSQIDVGLSVGVQKMVQARAAGVMFTKDPIFGDNSIVIDSSWGVGESVVGGKVTPDHFVVDKSSDNIITEEINDKKIMTTKDKEGTHEVEVPIDLRTKPSITTEKVKQLSKTAKIIEAYFGKPMDIEWAFDQQTGRLFILQSRPLTT